MSESRKINTNPVSALDEADSLMASDSAGGFKSVTVSKFLDQAASACACGGRNLIRQSVKVSSAMKITDDGVQGNLDADSYVQLIAAVDMRPFIGEWLTFSMDVAGMNDSSLWEFSINNQNDAVKPLKNGRFFITFVGNEKNCPEKDGTILIDDRGRVLVDMSPSDLHLSNFMVERGKVAHDWSPAPEDILDRLTALEQRGGGNYLSLNRLRFARERRAA